MFINHAPAAAETALKTLVPVKEGETRDSDAFALVFAEFSGESGSEELADDITEIAEPLTGETDVPEGGDVSAKEVTSDSQLPKEELTSALPIPGSSTAAQRQTQREIEITGRQASSPIRDQNGPDSNGRDAMAGQKQPTAGVGSATPAMQIARDSNIQMPETTSGDPSKPQVSDLNFARSASVDRAALPQTADSTVQKQGITAAKLDLSAKAEAQEAPVSMPKPADAIVTSKPLGKGAIPLPIETVSGARMSQPEIGAKIQPNGAEHKIAQTSQPQSAAPGSKSPVAQMITAVTLPVTAQAEHPRIKDRFDSLYSSAMTSPDSADTMKHAVATPASPQMIENARPDQPSQLFSLEVMSDDALSERFVLRDSVETLGLTSVQATQSEAKQVAPTRFSPALVADSLVRAPDRPVEIALNPEELGRVRMSLSTTETGITLMISAERPETLDLMRRNIEDLAAEFRRLGYEDIGFQFGTGSEKKQMQSEAGSADFAPRGADQQDAAPEQPLRLATTGLDMRL